MTELTKLTEPQHRALMILSGGGPLGWTPREFAGRMWPESFQRYSRVAGGKGVVTGAGVSRKAGGWLRQLVRRGWLSELDHGFYSTFHLTAAGKKILSL